MVNSNSESSVNPKNGFCSKTQIFHSIRPPYVLPSQSNLSVTDFIFSLLNTTTATGAASLIDATTGRSIAYSNIPHLVRSLGASLRQPPLSLCHGDCAFIISQNSSYLPILYLSLFSIGVIVSPANPASSISEISHQTELCKPIVIFATTETIRKTSKIIKFSTQIVLMDSDEFKSMMQNESFGSFNKPKAEVLQSDTAAILYSSGTTGKIKGVNITHRNLISSVAGAIVGNQAISSSAVYLSTVPYFHIYGFTLCIRMVAFGDSLVSIGRFDLRLMVKSIEEFKVTHLAAAPPVMVALVNRSNESMVNEVDWRSLETVFSGGAPLTVAVIGKFKDGFLRLLWYSRTG